LTVTSDTTARNGTGPSFTQLFGVDPQARADRTTNFAVNSKWLANPALLPNAALNLSAASGTVALSSGDTRGVDALAQAGKTKLAFPAAGALPASVKSVSDYSAAVSGQIAASAAAAQSTQTNADATLTEANTQRSSVEGVNMDQELINLTTYQQAYNASARLITAAKDMMDILLQTVQ
jgi:flagellar hook-associated protein 1 FlgK